MRLSRFAAPVLLLMVLMSCGDTAIFLAPVEEAAKVRVETIVPGSVQKPGAALPLAIARDPVFTGNPETADQLFVELLDAEELVLAEEVYESVDQADELPDLILPDLGEGLFILRISYFDGDDLIQTDDVPFFITWDEYEITGVSSYPATLYPGSAGLLTLNALIPAGADPYLEWYLDDQLVEAGLFSEIGGAVQVGAPDESGSYTLRVDLYPEPVPADLDVSAPVTYATELPVGTERVLGPTSLAPERSYFTLHHFLGDTRDDGARMLMFDSPPGDSRLLGMPGLDVASDVFGYALQSGHGVEIDGFILPVQNGELSPFSVSFRIRLAELEAERETGLLTVLAEDTPVLELLVSENGALVFSAADSHRVETEPGALAVGFTSVVTLSVLPLGELTALQFYVDGLELGSEILEWDSRELELPEPVSQTEDGWMLFEGSAVIGGDGGFAGILDEFGVFFRDDVDRPSPATDIFLSAMEQLHGDKLVYAEGFESSELPENLDVEGEALLETGRLVLGSGASVMFPLFEFNTEELVVVAALDDLSGAVLRFYPGDAAEPAAVIRSDELGLEEAVLEFTFTHSGATLSLTDLSGESVITELDPADEFQGLRLEVEADEPVHVGVQSVVAWKENPQIPESILDPLGATDEQTGTPAERQGAEQGGSELLEDTVQDQGLEAVTTTSDPPAGE